MNKILVFLLPGVSILVTLLVFFVSRLVGQRLVLEKLRPGSRVFHFSRRVVYALALLWAYGLFWHVTKTYPSVPLSLTAFMRYCGLTAIALLFVVLTPGLILSYFPRLSINGLFVHMRRALGVSVFFFILLHSTTGFFYNLGGSLASLAFLSERHKLAIAAADGAYIIFLLLTLTSFDFMVAKLGNARWKFLHRFVYVASILVLFHAFLIGSHFTNTNAVIPLLINGAALTFILLEVGATVVRTYALGKRLGIFRIATLVGLVISAFVVSNIALTSSYDPHAKHKKGYSKDYTMAVKTNPSTIQTGKEVALEFQVTDKRTGKLLTKYQPTHEKLMHLMVVRKDLEFYEHIHPEYDGAGTFRIATVLPTAGTYSLFAEYSPPDFAENLSTVILNVGDTKEEKQASLAVGSPTGVFAQKYQVSLAPVGPFKVNETVDFVFTLEDAQTHQPIENLEPYLAAFGHMAAISADLKTYTHVHPFGVPLGPTDRGGPTVQFSTFFPKAGLYKLFTQFKHGGNVFLTQFIVEAK